MLFFDYYESDEELFAKMMASGNSTYDIKLASSDYVSIMKELGLLQIIDLSKIPNRKYIAVRDI
jgi:spermidine/putrescine transport system substrate-binding protein